MLFLTVSGLQSLPFESLRRAVAEVFSKEVVMLVSPHLLFLIAVLVFAQTGFLLWLLQRLEAAEFGAE